MNTEPMVSNMPKSRYFNEDRVDLRFKAPGKHRSFKISKLWDIHREIARRVALGQTNKSIAEELGISTATVGYTKGSKAGEDQIGILRGAMDADTIDLGIQIQKFAPVALKLLEDIVEGTGPGKDASIALRAKVADKHVDRAGYSPVKKVASVTSHLTKEDIESIKERSRRSAKEAGISVDAEFTEI